MHISVFIKKAFKKIFKLSFKFISTVFIYLYEFITSIFNKSIRVCFTNFWGGFLYSKYYNFFNDTIKDYFGIKSQNLNKHLKYRIVKYFYPNIHIFSVFGKKEKIIKSKSNVKIFYTGENVNAYRFTSYIGNCTDISNCSIGFEHLNNDNYIRLPNWIIDYFPYNSSKEYIQNILFNNKDKYIKNKFCSLISRHDRSGLRTKMYNDISVISNIDCPGDLLHNDDSLVNNFNNNKLNYLQEYKFNICPENSASDGYVTEKIIESLLAGCIPIYNGYSKNPEPEIINPGVILWYDEIDIKNNELTLKMIKELYENKNYYQDFINQPFFLDTAIDKIYSYLCNYKSIFHKMMSKFF